MHRMFLILIFLLTQAVCISSRKVAQNHMYLEQLVTVKIVYFQPNTCSSNLLSCKVKLQILRGNWTSKICYPSTELMSPRSHILCRHSKFKDTSPTWHWKVVLNRRKSCKLSHRFLTRRWPNLKKLSLKSQPPWKITYQSDHRLNYQL